MTTKQLIFGLMFLGNVVFFTAYLIGFTEGEEPVKIAVILTLLGVCCLLAALIIVVVKA